MPLSDELSKLEELHQRGALSDDEYARAKTRVLGNADTTRASGTVAAANSLRRSLNDRWLGGVCGGLAELSGVASWIWRLIFAVSVLCAGTGIAIYLLLWIFVPQAQGGPLGGGRREPA